MMLSVVPFIYVGYRICRTILALIKAIFIYLLAPLFYSPNLKPYVNRWTVVTGCTDGIGKAYTIELAKRGLRKFVLIGRNQTKLSDIKTYLELSFGCRVKTYVFDFSKDNYDELRKFVSDIDVGFVVNSVGVGRENLERYGDNPDADRQILKVNGLGAAEFLSLILPTMEKSGGGQIVVLSSSQGYRPIPYLASYSASKAMMSFLCECIDREYKTISVQCLTPALVATKMVYYEKGSLFVVTPEQFAKEAVNSIGLTARTSGCFNHELQLLAMHLFPWTILKHLIMPIYYHQRRRMTLLHAAASAEKQGVTRMSAKA
ncbi:oxidoreductase, short chain dehydrogenase/reductase family protein [Dictyocaulus viviparus]|uniref:Oxidoreductase, short chain dehydrogenase/reductase family protein n=1 Tax=Dictyocaulus viviparus TaxID=29172 RepID=A0A0D8Y490_DICVI|nr:oxidoreductase, short chain dehydrogenase/reductase family protein [Dictyocaulus viviparus]